MPQVSLKVLGGKHDGEIISISTPKFLVGREGDCHLRPNSDMISRHHCAFTVDDYGLRLRDLGSTNGTFVNGERLRGVVQLNDGDQVSFGKLQFEVHLGEAVQPKKDQTYAPETAEMSSEETHYEIPTVSSQPAESQADGETTIMTNDELAAQPAPQPEPQIQQEAVHQAPPGQQGMPYPYPGQYPQQGYYPPMGYPPQMGGYYPQYPPPYGYPQPVSMQPYPPGYPQQQQQPQYPQHQPEQPVDEPESSDMLDVRLPDPSATGAADEDAGGKKPSGSSAAETSPSEYAADIIRKHLSRRPTSE